MTFQEIAALIITSSAVLSAVVLMIKYGKKMFLTIKPWVTHHARIASLEAKMGNLEKSSDYIMSTLDEVLSEVKTNGAGITLRKAIEREVDARWRDYELNGRALWETGILKNGTEFGCTKATDALFRLVGQSPLGKGWLNAIHPDEQEDIVDACDRAIEKGVPYDQLQRFVHTDKTGRLVNIVYCRALFKPEFDEAGQFTGGLGEVFEITESEYIERLKEKEM